MSGWVDFKALRATLDFEQVLKHYQVEVKRKGDQHHGFCPLPGHQGRRNSPSFSANLKRGIFQCFGCGAKGNVLEFAAMMEGIDPNDGAAFRGIASELQRHFGLDAVKTSPAKTHACTRPEQKAQNAGSSPAVVNAPLDFQLQGLDAGHPYLISRGLTPDTIAFFCPRLLFERTAKEPRGDSAA